MKLAHVIPNFHNPAGCTLSAAKRQRLVELAAEHDFCDLRGRPLPADLRSRRDELPPTMLSMDDGGRVIHASSFSKTVSPGVRVGYLAGPADEIATLAKRGSEHYISPNMLAESVVLELCRSGALATNIEFVNERPARAARRAGRGAPRADPRGRVRRPRRRLLPLARPRRRRRHAPTLLERRQGARASPSSPAPTSCSRAGGRACGSRSPACPPTASPRASPGSPGRSIACAPPARPDLRHRHRRSGRVLVY